MSAATKTRPPAKGPPAPAKALRRTGQQRGVETSGPILLAALAAVLCLGLLILVLGELPSEASPRLARWCGAASMLNSAISLSSYLLVPAYLPSPVPTWLYAF